MRHPFLLPDSFDAAFDQWAAGALLSNLLWTRCLGKGAIAAAREQRLRERIDHARGHSPFYRNRYRDLPADAPLDRLPPVTKSELMASFDDWATDRAVSWREVEAFIGSRKHIGQRFLDRYLVWTSSGTTGTPGVFVQDAAALSISAADPLNLVGILTPGERVPAIPGRQIQYGSAPIESVGAAVSSNLPVVSPRATFAAAAVPAATASLFQP